VRGWGLCLLAIGCGADAGTPYAWVLPAGFPEPVVPNDNPLTVEKIELGRHLFYDRRLSFNETTSCGSCHDQAKAFADGRPVSEGATGDRTARNAMGLGNVAWFGTYTWANPVLETLEQQALVPMLGERPLELGTFRDVEGILDRFRGDPVSQAQFLAAFPEEEDPYTLANVARALASFQRILVSGGSSFDRWFHQGDGAEFSAAAQRGFQLFNSERFECYHCHAGPTFSTSFYSVESTQRPYDFHNTGLYDLDGQGAYPANNWGLKELTQAEGDMGKFRVPSLRNVALTAPYLHDGSAETLAEVLLVYADGGRVVNEGPYAGDGRTNPHKSPLVRAFPMTDAERDDLISFLESLSDPGFVSDPRFAPP
jgi:cytochrome c peroxidase